MTIRRLNMAEDKRWLRFLQPGITAIVGAGGKTTVLERLVTYGHGANLPIVVTSTVTADTERLGNAEQIDIIRTDDRNELEAFCAEKIEARRVPAWIPGDAGLPERKAFLAETLDYLRGRHPAWYNLAEADVAHHKWLKAPLADDIPLPQHCNMIIGVVNLQMLGSPLTEERVAGAEQAALIMNRPLGAVVTPALLAKLIRHPRGLFRSETERRVLFCSGYNAVQHRMTEALLDDLEDLELDAIVLADGYRETCTIRQYISRGTG